LVGEVCTGEVAAISASRPEVGHDVLRLLNAGEVARPAAVKSHVLKHSLELAEGLVFRIGPD
jgi:hypothetical protein